MFWDTSAVVPLLVDQPASTVARDRARADPSMVVWWSTPVVCASALARLEREQVLDVAGVDASRGLLHELKSTWYEVAPTDAVRGHASRLLLRHPIRAADALQLGAALVWAEDRPDGHRFFTLDDRLGAAARREGFSVIDFR